MYSLCCGSILYSMCVVAVQCRQLNYCLSIVVCETALSSCTRSAFYPTLCLTLQHGDVVFGVNAPAYNNNGFVYWVLYPVQAMTIHLIDSFLVTVSFIILQSRQTSHFYPTATGVGFLGIYSLYARPPWWSGTRNISYLTSVTVLPLQPYVWDPLCLWIGRGVRHSLPRAQVGKEKNTRNTTLAGRFSVSRVTYHVTQLEVKSSRLKVTRPINAATTQCRTSHMDEEAVVIVVSVSMSYTAILR